MAHRNWALPRTDSVFISSLPRSSIEECLHLVRSAQQIWKRLFSQHITLPEAVLGVAVAFAAYYIFISYAAAQKRFLRQQIWAKDKSSGWQDFIPFSKVFASTKD